MLCTFPSGFSNRIRFWFSAVNSYASHKIITAVIESRILRFAAPPPNDRATARVQILRLSSAVTDTFQKGPPRRTLLLQEYRAREHTPAAAAARVEHVRNAPAAARAPVFVLPACDPYTVCAKTGFGRPSA